jgi:hypothetical protein
MTRRPRAGTAAAVTLCCFLMVFTSLVPSNATASGGGGSGGGESGGNVTSGTGQLPFPYAIPASVYPGPGLFPTQAHTSGVAVTPMPQNPSGFEVIYATVPPINSSSSWSLYSTSLTYSSIDARAVALSGTCGPTCGKVPLNVTAPELISRFDAPVGGELITSSGTMLVVAATSAGTTYLYNLSAGGTDWQRFGPAISGTLQALAADPEQIATATMSGTSVEVTTLTSAGAVEGQATLHPTGTGSTGVIDAGLAITPFGPSYLESLVFSTKGSDLIEFASSTNAVNYSVPVTIERFSVSAPEGALETIGQTILYGSKGVAGQLSLAAVGTGLFLMFTTNSSGYTVPETAGSGDNGTTWDGPYLSGPTNGSVLDPVVTSGPSGLVHSAWASPDYGSGSVETGTYFADGLPMISPQAIPVAGVNGTSPTG